MSVAAKTMVKSISMATNGCLISVPSIFTSSKASYPSVTFKSTKQHHLSCSYSSSLSLPSLFFTVKKTEPFSRISAALQEEEQQVGEESDGGYSAEAVGDAGESDGYAEPPEEAKVYVGNMPFDVDSENLAKLFEKAGVVEIAEVIYNRDTDQSRGFGFVTMSSVAEAEKAVEMFNRYDLQGRLLTVNIAAPKGSRAERPPRVFEPTSKIYVGNLAWNVDDERLEQVFSEYGKVVSARVVSDRETGRSRGFGFVEMSSTSEMNDAIANLDGQSLDGRAIRVNAAENRPRRNSF